MTKMIIVSLAIVSLSTSAAWALKASHHAAHHAKKPAASTAMNTSGPTTTWPFGGVSSADKEMYLRNKRESGVK